MQYFADTPDGAWAEFLRHEGITDDSELVNVRRSLWAVELPERISAETPTLTLAVLTGGINTYEACQEEARRLRKDGVVVLRAISAALRLGSAGGWKVHGGLQRAAERDGTVVCGIRCPFGFPGLAHCSCGPRSSRPAALLYPSLSHDPTHPRLFPQFLSWQEEHRGGAKRRSDQN